MTARHLLVESEGDIVTITLDRPEKRNALALDVMLELTETFEHVGNRTRSASSSPRTARSSPPVTTSATWPERRSTMRATCSRCAPTLMDTVQSIPQPVVARVHALATAAGCQLVATCDLAVAAQSASFAIPGGKGGLFCHTPLVAVARNIGRKRALEMALTGDPIDASTAAEWGLINRAVPDDELDAAVHDLITRATRGSALVEGARQAWLLRPDRPRPAIGVQRGGRAHGASGDGARRAGRVRGVPRQAPRRSSGRVRTTGHRRPSTDRLAPTVTPRAPRRGCVTRHVRGDCGSCGWSRPVLPR